MSIAFRTAIRDALDEELAADERVILFGEDGTQYTYQVTWSNAYAVAELTAEALGEIVGPTKRESVTLITCGGTFNYSTGEYDQRFVVPAERALA